MTISKCGQEWHLPAQLGQLKTGQDGKRLLQIHLWCPDDLPRLWDRIEIDTFSCHFEEYCVIKVLIHFEVCISLISIGASTLLSNN